MYDIIKKKRDGQELSSEEIYFVVKNYVSGDIPDYQMAALLMAIYFQGLNERETYDLTVAMANSGEILDLSEIPGTKLDKHSTGGVGDKVTLVVLPIVACFGAKIAKMSGRGLGHTGGTIDKLQSIPGMRLELSRSEFFKVVKEVGFSIVSQSGNLVPADKKIYALRDTTATVDSISLIASSIVSKKLASGSDAIVFDVKVGSGAFLKDVESARKLAGLMIDILRRSGKASRAVLSNMDQPLGRMVGNSLEVIEAIECLKGHGPEDLEQLSVCIASEMLEIAGISVDRFKVREAIVSKEALKVFKKFIKAQGGDERVVDDYSRLPVSKEVVEFRSTKEGYVFKINTEAVGLASVLLGAGRNKKEDSIDYSVGIEVLKKVGDFVRKNEPIAKLYVGRASRVTDALKLMEEAYDIGDEKPKVENTVLEVMR